MSDVVMSSYAEAEPRALDNFRTSTAARSPETYYRCGYLVAGGNPIMVKEHCRSEAEAEELACTAAMRVRNDLLKLGAPADVSLWTQRWQIQHPVEYSEARVEQVR